MATAIRTQAVEHDVVANGVRLRLREVGDVLAPSVLFLHGIMGHRREWDVLVDRLGETHHVVAVDQRGHGRSEWTRSYRVADMAADAIALIEQRFTSPVPIVGHSMGAMVALLVAARRPELVERIASIDIVPESLTTEFAHQMPAMFEAMANASYGSADEAFAEWHAGNRLARPDLLRNYITHALAEHPDGRLRWGFDARGLRSFTDGIDASDLWAAIDAVRCPTLLVRGEHSPVTTEAQIAVMAHRLGDARVVEIVGGGHDLGVEQPEAVTTAVMQFLSPTHEEITP